MAFNIEQLVYFDIETTGLDPIHDNITQICAIHDDNVYMQYVTPNCPINPNASEITSIYYDKDSNIMTHRDQQVQHLPTHTILEGLLEFLSKINSLVLVAHNGKRFDFIFLYRAAMSCDLLTRFRDTLDTFMDTLPLSRTVLNYYRPYDLKEYISACSKKHFRPMTPRKIQKLCVE